jgi:hypothetical protein
VQARTDGHFAGADHTLEIATFVTGSGGGEIVADELGGMTGRA